MALLVGAVSLVSAGAAVAADEALDDPPAGHGSEPVVLVLDASGSMRAEDGGDDATRMEIAQQAVIDLIEATPPDAQLGVLVYGSQVGNSEADKEAGCQDIITLADVGPVDAESLTNAVQQVSASGWTPVGASLQQAADALPDGGSVVLVSDGIDTCAPPEPCEVAEELADSGVDLTIHTVGFRVDAAAREQLRCIAETTGGTYADAADAAQLSEEMSVQVQRAMRSYVPAGRTVTGGADAASAVDITQGDYVLHLSSADGRTPPRAVQHFRLPMREGDVVHAAASLIRPQDGGPAIDQAVISVTQVGEGTCRSELDMNSASNTLGGPPTAVLVTAPAAADDGCFPEGYAVLAVERSGEVAVGQDLPVELSVRISPPVDPDTIRPVPQAELELPTVSNSDAAAALSVTPGLNYSTATPLSGGASYSSEATHGEFHVYTVHLEPGQRLAAAVRPEAGLGDNASVQLNIAAPDRTALPLIESSIGYRRGSFVAGIRDGDVLADGMAATVSPASPQAPNVAGDYYLMVSFKNRYAAQAAVPYTLRVEVAGDPVTEPTPLADTTPLTEAGKAASATGPGGDTAQVTDQPEGTPTGETEGTSTDVAPPEAADDAAEQGAAQISPLVWVLAGTGLLLVAGGAWLLAPRRKG